jgi:hypothetical protein
MASDDISIAEVAESYADDIFVGLDRGIEARNRDTLPPNRFIDVQFAQFCADPLAAIGRIYAALDRELTAEAEARMRAFLAGNPGDGGGDRYRFADTGLDAGVLRERSIPYQERFAVESEPLP